MNEVSKINTDLISWTGTDSNLDDILVSNSNNNSTESLVLDNDDSSFLIFPSSDSDSSSNSSSAINQDFLNEGYLNYWDNYLNNSLDVTGSPVICSYNSNLENSSMSNLWQQYNGSSVYSSSITGADVSANSISASNLLVESSYISNPIISTLTTATFSLFEGLANIGEDAVDFVALTGTGVSSLITLPVDLILGNELDDSLTSYMWDNTQDFVSNEVVTDTFNDYYNNNSMGQWFRDDAYQFNIVRGIGNMAGELAGTIGLSFATFGTGSIFAPTTSTFTLGASQLAMTSGALGFASGTQNAWNNGASLEEGTITGVFTGLWDATQFYVGAKIGSSTFFGTNGLFGNFNNNVVNNILNSSTKIILDGLDGAAEGFAQPVLQALYADGYYDANGNYISFDSTGTTIQDTNNFMYKWQQLFDANGGFNNVAINALYGSAFSAVGEFFDLTRFLRNNGNDNVSVDEIINETLVGDSLNETVSASFLNDFNSNVRLDAYSSDNLLKIVTDDDIYTKFFDFSNNRDLFSGKSQTEYANYLKELVELAEKNNYDLGLTEIQKIKVHNIIKNYANSNLFYVSYDNNLSLMPTEFSTQTLLDTPSDPLDVEQLLDLIRDEELYNQFINFDENSGIFSFYDYTYTQVEYATALKNMVESARKYNYDFGFSELEQSRIDNIILNWSVDVRQDSLNKVIDFYNNVYTQNDNLDSTIIFDNEVFDIIFKKDYMKYIESFDNQFYHDMERDLILFYNSCLNDIVVNYIDVGEDSFRILSNRILSSGTATVEQMNYISKFVNDYGYSLDSIVLDNYNQLSKIVELGKYNNEILSKKLFLELSDYFSSPSEIYDRIKNSFKYSTNQLFKSMIDSPYAAAFNDGVHTVLNMKYSIEKLFNYSTHETLHHLSNNNGVAGVMVGDNYRGMNEAITEYFNKIFRPSSTCYYDWAVEKLSDLINAEIFSIDDLKKAYFTNDISVFFDRISEITGDVDYSNNYISKLLSAFDGAISHDDSVQGKALKDLSGLICEIIEYKF